MRPDRSRRAVLGGFAALILLVLLLGAWVGIRGYLARGHLVASRAAVVDLRAAVVDGDTNSAEAALARASRHAANARWLTSDVAWRTLAHVPTVGDAAATARGIAVAVDDITRGPLRTLVTARASLDPTALRRDDGSIDLALLAAPQPRLASALVDISRVRRAVGGLPRDTQVTAVDEARQDLAAELARLEELVGHAETATRVAPPMLGANGVRRYFVAFQNNAESRGTGGLLGAYGILEARRGKLRMVRVGSNRDLKNFPRPVISLGRDFDARYRSSFSATTRWDNSNLSPHFPYAARIWLAMWQRQFGERLDGAIATDPSMLGHLLKATGPVRLPDGEQVTATNVVDLTERAVYTRFEADNDARKDFLELVARAVSEHVLHRAAGSAKALSAALRDGAAERRLLVWTRFPDEADVLAGTSLGGTLPDTDGPFVALVVNNGGGNKLDYYLDRSVTYHLGRCVGDGMRRSRVEITLTNTVPPGDLPDYVVGGRHERVRGSNTVIVSLFASKTALLENATHDGRPAAVPTHVERGRPAFTQTLRLLPRESQTIAYDLLEKISEEAPVVVEQPIVRAQDTRVTASSCDAPGPIQ